MRRFSFEEHPITEYKGIETRSSSILTISLVFVSAHLRNYLRKTLLIKKIIPLKIISILGPATRAHLTSGLPPEE